MSATVQPIAEDAPAGDVYLRELVRLQLTVSTTALVAFGGVIGALPLLILLSPPVLHATLAGIPLWLLLLGPPPFLLFFAIGWLYCRRADALDEEFADLVRQL
jgi:Protein of unknown function, DUF485